MAFRAGRREPEAAADRDRRGGRGSTLNEGDAGRDGVGDADVVGADLDAVGGRDGGHLRHKPTELLPTTPPSLLVPPLTLGRPRELLMAFLMVLPLDGLVVSLLELFTPAPQPGSTVQSAGEPITRRGRSGRASRPFS
jgi:hypothetical protein